MRTWRVFAEPVTYVLQPSVNDVNDIKCIEGLATSINNTYITLTNASCEDLAGNPLVGIYNGMALQGNNVTLDISPPVLDDFNFDLNTGILTLTFDEVVDASTLVIEQIQFVSDNTSMPNSTYYLTENSTVSDYNDLVLTVTLSDSDLNNLKFYQDLATSDMTTYLNFSSDTVFDTSSNGILSFSVPQQVGMFTTDTTRPYLVEYQLSINDSILILSFSETMNISSFDTSRITFQNSQYDNFTASLDLTSIVKLKDQTTQ